MTDIQPRTGTATTALADADARFPAVALTLRHWASLRGDRPMPARDEIDPRDLAGALEFLFIAEPIAAGVARLRLAGQHLTHLLGMEPRGMPLCALFDGAARAEIGQAVEQVERYGMRALIPVRADGGIGRPALEGLLALMPLGDGGGRSSRLLGVLQTRGVIGRGPRRLALAGPAMRLPDALPRRPMLRVIPGGRS